MKKLSVNGLIIVVRVCIGIFIACLLSLVLLSFTLAGYTNDFLGKLGISQPAADQKISTSIINGYFNQYGIRNAKNIAVNDRQAVTLDLLQYTKNFVNSEAFKKQYLLKKEESKPAKATVQTPEEMQADMIKSYEKALAENEASLKKADASMKPIFENVLKLTKDNLKAAQDPNNPMFVSYRENYPDVIKTIETQYQQQLQQWETEYPANQMLFVKKRLEQFLQETANVDYAAALQERDGKKYFVNKSYESKGSYWKMAFRAGKEVIEPARTFVKEWISTIN